MAFFGFIGDICISVLVAYLSFTNSLALKIESILPSSYPEKTIVTTQNEKTKTISEELTQAKNSFTGSVSRILLDHAEFQKAALLASDLNDGQPDVRNEPITDVVKGALVNIYCQYKTDDYIRTTTGTGFFINEKGVILTNAHVAQFLLLKDAKKIVNAVDCDIRTGDPATPKYKAELLYISPTWVFENATVITDESPRGTGERDYALLYVSKTTDGNPLQTRFPSIPVDVALLSRGVAGASVVTAGYPAEALMRSGAEAKLAPVLASTTIGTLYTFGSNYADIFSISESPVGEQGASGGPIVTTDAHSVIGLIVTKGDEQTEGAHSLRAITLSYVDRTILEETGYSLLQNIQGDVAQKGTIFKRAMTPFLAKILEEQLQESE